MSDISKSNKNLESKYQSVLDTIKLYPAQLRQAWEEIAKLELPHDFQHINKVAVCGMGGSALGARIVDSLLINRIRVPVEIFNQYHIPNYTDDKTLVIVYSYSGNTEETVESLHEAITRDTKIIGITAGGKLKELLAEHELPLYIIDPINNPSGQPRMALGYAVGAILSLFSKLALAHVSEEDIRDIIQTMQKAFSDYAEITDPHDNLALSFAHKIKDKAPILVASEHLYGTAYSIKNQFNESAKTFSVLFELPELNHHLLEGLGNPQRLKRDLVFVFFNSHLYSDRVQKRYPITYDVVEKNKIDQLVFQPRSESRIEQVFETFVFGSFVVYYLSKLYNIDPTEIPWVDYFKEKLAAIK